MDDNKMPLRDLRDWTPEYVIANESTCKLILEDSDALRHIPPLDNAPLDNFTHKQLVRFRGMIQDMYNPEYYLEKYEVKNTITGISDMRCGMYTDSMQCSPQEEVILESKKNKSSERRSYIVISIPGLNPWARENRKVLDSHSRSVISNKDYCKRNCEEDIHVGDNVSSAKKIRSSESMETDQSSAKQQCTLSQEHILNFPITIHDGKACIVKIYNENHELKLNQIIEIIGFLSLDPTLYTSNYSDEIIDDPERSTHEPPPSLVPRLHALKVIECNTFSIPSEPQTLTNVQCIRGDLHILLSQLLFGDGLAADYLICHLLSSVYLRNEYLNLGSFPLNITNFSSERCANFPRDLYDALTHFIEKSHFLELTLDTLNDHSFTPKKDYECERLTSGILQLSDNTHLVIDETKLTTGQVSQHGRDNYNTITNLIRFQKVQYDFKFYKMDFPTDIPVLILSRVKSFIPCPIRVVLKPDSDSEKMYAEIISASKMFLKEEQRLNGFRQYIQILRHADFELNSDITPKIQEDFVKMRQSDKSIAEEDLHSLIVLARLLSLSHGMHTVTSEMWEKAVKMEEERRHRLPHK